MGGHTTGPGGEGAHQVGCLTHTTGGLVQGGGESRAQAWGECPHGGKGGKGVGVRDILGDASGYGAGQGEGMGGHKRQPGVCPRVYPCLHTSALQVPEPLHGAVQPSMLTRAVVSLLHTHCCTQDARHPGLHGCAAGPGGVPSPSPCRGAGGHLPPHLHQWLGCPAAPCEGHPGLHGSPAARA